MANGTIKNANTNKYTKPKKKKKNIFSAHLVYQKQQNAAQEKRKPYNPNNIRIQDEIEYNRNRKLYSRKVEKRFKKQ